MKTALHWLSHAIFWIWNITFIGIVYLWMLPTAGLPILEAARLGEIPPAFVVSILGLLIVPLICTIVGGKWLRKHPILLMRLFYGVEAPLFGLCLLRLFLIRDTTPASAHILMTVTAAIAMFAIETLAGYAAYRPRLAWVQMIGHSLILITGLYAGTLLLLYTVPAFCFMVYGTITSLLNMEWSWWLPELDWMLRNPGQLILGLLFFTIWVSSCAVFISMPYVLVNFYVRSWHRIRTAFAKQHGHSWAVTGAVVGISCLLFGVLQMYQPQATAFSLLERSAPQTTTARIPLIKQSEIIRKGLLHGYLYRYRYLGTAAESNQLRHMYTGVFDMSKADAQVFQNVHNALLSPFLYRGDRNDDNRAEALYASFFDTSIQKAERTTIRQALQATANRDETQAGVLNLDQKVIRLAEQTVSVKENGDWAELEIYEHYENKTADDQEIFYSFSLPESATITGLWLGEVKDAGRFPFVVSPRGAAQQVYKGEIERAEQTRQAEDPALLEQVGPRQYRLRVFPIPAAASTREPGELHLWMTYQVLQQEGAWPLPQLTEKRNIFWTDQTVHQRRDKSVLVSEDTWFEPSLQAKKKAKAITHQIQLDEGYQVTATPMAKTVIPKGKQIAAILDTSYSMGGGGHLKALKQLEKIEKQNDLDFYRTTATGETLTPEKTVDDLDILVPYGSLQPAEMLRQFAEQQFAEQHLPKNYDAILLLTDAGSYELTEEDLELPELSAPLWLVHVGNQLPAAYDDKLLEAIQKSGGGVATDVTAVLQRLDKNVIDGYEWSVVKQDGKGQADGFMPVAARQMILQRSRTVDMTQLENLDAVHAVAKRAEIVTPYSSMLVLVNERQRELLRQAEAAADRFDREVEDGQDELTDPNNPLNTVAVPEPGSVIAMGAMAVSLLVLKRKRSVDR